MPKIEALVRDLPVDALFFGEKGHGFDSRRGNRPKRLRNSRASRGESIPQGGSVAAMIWGAFRVGHLVGDAPQVIFSPENWHDFLLIPIRLPCMKLVARFLHGVDLFSFP